MPMRLRSRAMTPRSLVSARLVLDFVPNARTFGLACGSRSGAFRLACEGALAGSLSLVGRSGVHADIGYHIAPAFRGRGLASEAVRALIAAAPSFGLTLLSAQCRSDNPASRRVLEKAGFTLSSSSPFGPTGHGASILYMFYHRALAPIETEPLP